MTRLVSVAAVALCIVAPLACGRATPVAVTTANESASPPLAADSPSPSPSPGAGINAVSQPVGPVSIGHRPRPIPAPPCPAFGLKSFTVGGAGAYRQATVSWSTTGGCAPFQGDVGASSFQPPLSSQLPIHSASGSVVDTLPFGTACTPPTSANVTFYMVLSDGAGHSITPSETTRMVPISIC